MVAVPKLLNQIEPDNLHNSDKLSVPEGFEVVLADGITRRVKLRRALHSGAPLGIAIISKEGRRSVIEQFDIGPRLDSLTRTTIQDVLLRVYLQLKVPNTFAEGKLKLEELASEGFCVGCRFSTVSR